MRRTLALLVLLPLAAALAACGGDGGSGTSPAATTTPATSAPADSPSPQTLTASVGEALTLHGQEEGSEVEVTVAEVIDPYTLSGILVPEEGTRIVAFDLQLTNTGTTSFQDSPGNGAVLFDVDDVEWNSVVTGEDAGLVTVTLAPGDSANGLIYFQLPEDLATARLQITLSSGFGPDTGEWTI